MNTKNFTDYLNKKDLSSKTVETYCESMNHLSKKLFKKTDMNSLTLQDIQDYKKILTYIYSPGVTINKKRMLISSIVHYINAIPDYCPKIKECILAEKGNIYNFCKSASTYQKPTEKDIENKVSMKDIIDIREELKEGLTKRYNKNLDVKYLVLCLYTYLPPLRLQDYIGTKVYKKNNNPIEGENYVDLSKKELIIQDHKNKKHCGTRTIPLPDELMKVIKKFHKKADTIYLLPKTNKLDEPLKKCALVNMLARIIGKRVSSQILRKVFVSELLASNPTKEERERVSKIMGHSLITQRTVYNRYGDDLFFEQPDED